MTLTLERFEVEMRANNAQLVRKFRESTREAQRFSQQSTASIGRVARAAAGALGGTIAVSSVVQLSDAYLQVENRLRTVTNTAEAFGEAQVNVQQIALDTRTNLEAVATLYSRTARQAETLNINQQQVAQFTEAIAQALVSYGATAQEAAGATLQLSQALGAGRLNGDEFRAVSEAAPPILTAIAREAGVAEGKLKDMAAAGELSADLVVRAVLNSREAFEGAFDQINFTIGQNLEFAATRAKILAGESEALRTVMQGLSGAIVGAAENLDTIAAVGVGLGAVFGARLLGPITATTAAMVVQAPAAAASAVGLARYQAALLGTSKAAATASVTLGAARTALAAIGGPGGIAILAGLALLTFADGAESAEERAARLADEAKRLNDSLQLNNAAQLNVALVRAEEDFAALEARQASLRAQIQETTQDSTKLGGALGVSGSSITQYARLNQELAEVGEKAGIAKEQIDDLRKRIKAAFADQFADSEGAAGETDELDKALKRTIESLERQVALFGDASAASRVQFEIDSGSFDNSPLEARQRALDLAVELDGLRERERLAEQGKANKEESDRFLEQTRELVAAQRERNRELEIARAQAQGDNVQVVNFRLNDDLADLDRAETQLRERNALTVDLERELQEARQNLILISEAEITAIADRENKKRLKDQEDLEKAKADVAKAGLDVLAGIAKQGSVLERVALASKAAITLREALLNFNLAQVKAAASQPFPANLFAVATTVGQLAPIIASIRSLQGQAHDGLTNVPFDGTFFLQNGERVVQRDQNRDLTEYLNNQENRRGGGGDVFVSVISNSGSQFAVDQVRDGDGNLRLMIEEVFDQRFSESMATGRGTIARALQSNTNIRRVPR